MAGAAGRHLVYHAGAQSRPMGFAVRSQLIGRCADVEKSVSFSGWSDLVNKVIVNKVISWFNSIASPHFEHAQLILLPEAAIKAWIEGVVLRQPCRHVINYLSVCQDPFLRPRYCQVYSRKSNTRCEGQETLASIKQLSFCRWAC
ncbi:hypothetical protein M404DRAFT_744092 [Pisolithus tinctorius Marx 270]|uniref:Uncharacterized protein n=1 Tax=Pisolithus tinctorius Marx 270 TaxID=870435 RepID=A0A0C3NJI3_PISTI|nr:hypothetical protein M404DRAFT_744092 [Pisolithus tinctorius Marx 270]